MIKGWYWYHRNWWCIFTIFFWITMFAAVGLLLSEPQKEYSIWVGIAIVGPAVVFVLVVGIMSWLAERYLRNYDADYRWHLRYNRGEKL